MKLLILTFSFYPYSTVSAFRMTRFAKYLPEYNIDPYIITAHHGGKIAKDDGQTGFPNVIYKKSLFSYRFDSPVNPAKYDKKRNFFSYTLNYLLRLIKDIALSPDKDILFSLSLIPTAYRLIKREQIKTLLVTGDPFSLFLAGRVLKKLTGVKLILDYRDPWLTNTSHKAQTFYRQWYIKRLQRKSLKDAAYVFTVNKEIYDELDTDPKKKEILTNGFDPEYFTLNTQLQTEQADNFRDSGSSLQQSHSKEEPFTFFYAGKLNVHHVRYNPLLMLRCFQKFRNTGADFQQARLLICGIVGSETIATIEEEKLSENVEFKGEVDNKDVIELGKKADALLHSVYPSKREVSLPMKIYEYIMLQKPIISINSEKGLVADMLAATKAGFSCNNDDEDKVVETMKQVFYLDQKAFREHINFEPIEGYNVKVLTCRLAEVIKRLNENSTVN